MKQCIKKLFVLGLVIIINSGSVEAKSEAETKEMIIGLQNIVEFITAKNIDVNIARTQISQAKSVYKQSFANFLPSVRSQFPVEMFNGGEVMYGADPVSLDRTTYRPMIYGDMQIQTGGKQFFDLRVYKHQINRANSTYDNTFQKNLLNACIAYYSWLKDFASMDVAKQAINEMDAQLKLNELKVKTGFGTQLDVMQTKTQLSEKKNLLLKSKNEQAYSKIELASLLNIPLTESIAPDKQELSPVFLWDKSLTLPKYYDIAFNNRPDIKELGYLISEAKAQYKSAFAEIFPSINLGGYLRGIGPEVNNLMSTNQRNLSLNFDFFRNLGLGTFNNIKTAKAKIQEAILNKEKRLSEIQKSLAQVYYDANFYSEQIPVTEEKMNNAKEAYRIALARLKTGVGMNFELIQAQSELTQARLEYQTAVMNNNISQLKLLYECGQLTPEKILGKAD